MIAWIFSGRGLLALSGLLCVLLLGSRYWGLGLLAALALLVVVAMPGLGRWQAYRRQSAAAHRRLQAEVTAMRARQPRD